MKKVAILGAAGMLGSNVYDVLKEKYKLILVVRSKRQLTLLQKTYGYTNKHKAIFFDFNTIYYDFLNGVKDSHGSPNFMSLQKKIGNVDGLINCVGITIPRSLRDPANTFFINSALPHLLATVYKQKMIHITTDCVFDGKQGFPYSEKSPMNPVDLYGLSKSIGEPVQCLTLRTSIIGPEISSFNLLLEWFRRQNKKTVHGFRKHFWNGITTKQFGIICDIIIRNRNIYPKQGLFHIFSDKVSKYEMLVKFREKYDVDCKIIPSDEGKINRTLSTDYDLNKRMRIPSFDEMLAEL